MVVSGAAAGIGASLVRRYVESGANVLAFDKVDPESLELGPLSDLDAAPGQLTYRQCDVTEDRQVQALLGEVVTSLGGTIDAFVHCIGMNMRKPLLKLDHDELDLCLEINFKSAFHLSVGLLPMFRSAGAIVFISSVAALRPRLADPAYSLSKMALNHLTVLLAAEIAERGIRLNGVCPGPTMSDRFLDERIIDPISVHNQAGTLVKNEILKDMPLARFHDCIPPVDAVIDAVDFLIGDRARFITGAVLPVDGGKSLTAL